MSSSAAGSSLNKPGFYGWKLVVVVFIVYLLNTAFPYYGGSVLNAVMAEDLGFSRSALGYGFSAFILCMGLTSPMVGVLVNKLGVRKTLFIGGLVLTVGALSMAALTATELQYWLFFGGISGLGFSLGGVIPVQSVVTYWFKRRKPLAMSVVLCASGVGSILSIPILNNIVASFDGDWRMGWYFVAFTSALSAFIALIWVRNKPGDLGQEPDGGAQSVSEVSDTKARPGAVPVYQSAVSWNTADAFRTRASWLIVAAACAYTMVFNVCIAHGVVHLRDQGIDDAMTANSVGLLIMSSIIGRLACGTVGGRIEPRLIWSGGLLALAAGLFVLSITTANWQVYVYALCAGIGFGASYVSMANIMGNYFGPDSFAPLLGVLTTVTCVVGALSPALAGISYDQLGGYEPAFNTFIGLALITSVGIALAHPPRRDRATTVSNSP
ncbi:MFS transporter [Congregibacter sp.]|uniref:MFS transporter n=1 Tax=Congregibacter sp. TaxID=2744308 RepID=UPI00385FE619